MKKLLFLAFMILAHTLPLKSMEQHSEVAIPIMQQISITEKERALAFVMAAKLRNLGGYKYNIINGLVNLLRGNITIDDFENEDISRLKNYDIIVQQPSSDSSSSYLAFLTEAKKNIIAEPEVLKKVLTNKPALLWILAKEKKSDKKSNVNFEFNFEKKESSWEEVSYITIMHVLKDICHFSNSYQILTNLIKSNLDNSNTDTLKHYYLIKMVHPADLDTGANWLQKLVSSATKKPVLVDPITVKKILTNDSDLLQILNIKNNIKKV